MESKIFKAPRLIKSKLSASTIRGGDGKSVVSSLNTTNKILVEIQNQLALDFANRISERKLQNARLKAAADKQKRITAEDRSESTGKFKSIFSGTLAKVTAPAKDIFSKILNFFGLLAGAFAVDKVLKWFGNEENQRKIDTAFTYLEKNGNVILKVLGAAVLGNILIKLLRVVTAIRKVTKALRIFSKIGGFLRKIPFFGKFLPKGGKGFKIPGLKMKFPGGKLLGPLATAFNFIDRLSQGQSLEQAAIGAGAGFAGFLAGAKTGAMTGAAIGSVLPGKGTLIGGFLGSVIGGMMGAFGAEKLADNLTGVENKNKGGLVTGSNVGNRDSVKVNATVGERFFDRETSSLRSKEFKDFHRGGPQYDAAIRSLTQSNMMLAGMSKVFTGSTSRPSPSSLGSSSGAKMNVVPPKPTFSNLAPTNTSEGSITVLPEVISKANSAVSAATLTPPSGGSSIPVLDVIDYDNDYIPLALDTYGIFVFDGDN